MQINSRKEIMVTGLFTALFLLGGFIHVLMNPWDLTSCIAQIYYSSLVLIWAVTINFRIVGKKVRQLMLATAGLFMLAMYFQMCRYRVFETFTAAGRYIWYGYYISVLLVPVLFLFVVLHLHLQEHESPDRRWVLMLLPSLFFIILILTNDLHQLIFIFISGSEGKSGTYTYGTLFYALYVWIIAVMVLSLYFAIRKCRLPGIGKKLWMPLYFAAYSSLLILSMFGLPEIANEKVWLFIECFAMVIIGMEEACIQLGLIPANSSYQMIAGSTHKPFIISDESGAPVYTAASVEEKLQRKESEIHTKPIKGGSVSWAVDMSDRIMRDLEIEKSIESIESRNEALRIEAALKEEQARLTARNMLYDQIDRIISPQLDTIKQLVEGAADARSLAKAAFLNAYIKRRSNMELLKTDLEHFPKEELASAVRESLEYLKLCGINAMLYTTPECELPADMQIFLYEAFEIVTESCLDTLEALLVNVAMREKLPALRMTLKAPGMESELIEQQLLNISGIVRSSIEAGDGELVITIFRKEGGSGI